MSWTYLYPLTVPLPFGAGSSLCPPDTEPPCTCYGDLVDPACPVDGDVDAEPAEVTPC